MLIFINTVDIHVHKRVRLTLHCQQPCTIVIIMRVKLAIFHNGLLLLFFVVVFCGGGGCAF